MNLKALLTIISFIIGLCWLSFFANRYFLHQTIFSETVNSLIFQVFLILSIILNLSGLILYIYNNKIPLLTNILSKTTNIFYKQPLEIVFNIVIKPIPGIGDFLMFIGKKITTYNHRKYFFEALSLLCIIITLIPRIVISIAFFIDVYFLNDFYYLAKILPILGPYLVLFHFLVFLIYDFSKHNAEILQTILKTTTQLINGKRVTYIEIKPELLLKHRGKLKIYTKQYLLFTEMYFISNTFIQLRDNIYGSSLKIITSCLYFIGFTKLLLLVYNITTYDITYFYLFIILSTISYLLQIYQHTKNDTPI